MKNLLFPIQYKFALICHKSLKSKNSAYSWFWLLLPHWRFYLLKYNNDRFKNIYSKYENYNKCPKSNRILLWKINGYKYKIFPKFLTTHKTK